MAQIVLLSSLVRNDAVKSHLNQIHMSANFWPNLYLHYI